MSVLLILGFKFFRRAVDQAWPSQGWANGAWSIAKFEIKEQGSETRLILDHTGFPDGDPESLRTGWIEHYWEPLKKYFA